MGAQERHDGSGDVPAPQHYSVLLAESLEYLAVRPDGVYADLTTGLGGHARAIAAKLGSGLLIACDRDGESLQLARASTAEVSSRIRFFQGAFSDFPEALAQNGITELDGAIADLGVSRYQLSSGERGFSLMADGPLDMRMDRSQGPTAADLVNQLPEKELADVIYELGEERRSRRISRAIVRARPIWTTGRLAQVIEEAVPRTGRLHPATQSFMALRLRVNGELDELEALLRLVPARLKCGGRFVVLTFMSLEDRIVKRAFQALARAGSVRLLNKHVITPGDEEIRANAASRSAKLRAVEKL